MNSLLTLLYEPNATPTVAISSPSDGGSTSDTTPDIVFTGTDPDGDDIRYQVQIDTAAFPACIPLDDDFSDNYFDAGKYTRTNATQVVETSAEMELSSILAGNYVVLDSVGKYDLTGKRCFLKIVDAGNQSLASWETYPLVLILDDNNYVEFRLIGNIIQAYKTVGGTSTQVGSNLSYVAATHKYLCTRESGGTCYFDWSTDGITWTNLSSVANPFAVTALKLEISVGTWQAEATTTTLKIDSLNVYPALINAVSGTDSGFSGSPDNTDPFASDQAVTYTVQSALSAGTYYLRVRPIDPAGSNVWGAWATRSFTVSSPNNFVIDDEASASSIENVALAQAGGTFSVADESSASSEENISLIGNFEILAEISQSSIDGVVLSRNGGDFAIADEASSSSIENIQLIGNLQIADESAPSSIENIVIQRAGGDLLPADEQATSSIENISLVGELSPANESSASSIENITLETGGGTFALGDISCPSTIDNVGLEGNLVIDGMTCSVTEEEITIVFAGATFAIDDINTSTTEEEITLQGNFKIDSINSPPEIENITLELGSGDFSVDGMTSTSSIGNIRIIKDIPEELKIIIIANTGAVCKWIGGNYYIEL